MCAEPGRFLTMLATFAAVVSATLAAAGLFYNAWVSQRQTNYQITLEYTRRWQELVVTAPPEWYHRFDDPPPKQSALLTRTLHLYLDFQCQEMYLHDAGHFTEEIWNIWQTLFIKTLKTPFFRREWPLLHNEFDYDPNFMKVINPYLAVGTQSPALPGSAAPPAATRTP